MQQTRIARTVTRLLAMSVTSVATATYVGCGSKENETVIPAETPAEKAKDSMDYYRDQMLKNQG